MGANLTLYPVQVANGYALATMFEASRFGFVDLSFLGNLQESFPLREELRWQINAYQRALQAEDKTEIGEWGRLIAGCLRSRLPAPDRNGRLKRPAAPYSFFGNGRDVLKMAGAALHYHPKTEYKIGSLIGKGGHAIVFSAKRKSDGKRVVIKVLRKKHKADPLVLGRFEREQRILAALRHPSLPVLFERGSSFGQSGLPFMIMEHLSGPDLYKWLEHREFLPWSEAKKVLLKLASLLEMCHRGGIVHRDLKPENIFLIVEGGRIKGIKLIDFSIALNLQESGSGWDERVNTVGTPLYAAPEQISGWPPQDGRTDIYGLGVLMFEILTGRPPFLGVRPQEVYEQHPNRPPPLFRNVRSGLRLPRGAQDIVLKALAKNPKDRFQTMAEMAEAIERCKS